MDQPCGPLPLDEEMLGPRPPPGGLHNLLDHISGSHCQRWESQVAVKKIE